MSELKIDLHAHCADDAQDPVAFSAEMLIDSAAKLNFDVLALTGHDCMVWTPRLAEFAQRRGVLLIPGVERLLEGKHVVIINPSPDHMAVQTFAELRETSRVACLIIAPHPYFQMASCLHQKLEEHIDLFDAIEYCNLYYRFLNLNRRAVKVANKYALPILGSSDCHVFPYSDDTHTLVEAEPDMIAVLNAVRKGRVRLETRPKRLIHAAQMLFFSFYECRRPKSAGNSQTNHRHEGGGAN